MRNAVSPDEALREAVATKHDLLAVEHRLTASTVLWKCSQMPLVCRLLVLVCE